MDIQIVSAVSSSLTNTPVLLYENETGAAQVLYVNVSNTGGAYELFFSGNSTGKPDPTELIACWDQESGQDNVIIIIDADEDLYVYKEDGAGFFNINVSALTDPVGVKVLYKGRAPSSITTISGLENSTNNRILLTATTDIVSTRFLMPYWNGVLMADLEIVPNQYYTINEYFINGKDLFQIESFNNEIDYSVRVALIPTEIPLEMVFRQIF